MSDHTPTPWKYEAPQGAFGHEVVGASRLVCQMSHHPGRQDEAVANAAFIVRACNSHSALVEALEYVRDNLCGLPVHEEDISRCRAKATAAIKLDKEQS